VTITGSNFSGATAVRFGSTAATSVMVNSFTQITATSPAGSGTVDVTVTAPGGTSPASSADKFSFGFARTWVSGTGDDTSQCTANAPCQTFAAAMALTLPGGEIDALDPGDFGPVTITKSLSIVGGQDVVAAVSLASGGTSGVTIAAGANDVIELRGLVFDGFAGTGASGVVFTSGAKLNIESCTFLGFPVGAITFSPGAGSAATAKMFVGGSNIFASGTGVVISPNAGIAADAWLIDTNVDGNSGDGVVADGTGGGGPISVVMTNASIGPNAGNGVNAMSGAGSVAFDISRSTIEANGLAGIRSSGASANVTADRSQISDNGVGLQSAGGGSLLSYSNNQVMDNGTNGSFTGTIGLH
jgi:IPT/TIG domain